MLILIYALFYSTCDYFSVWNALISKYEFNYLHVASHDYQYQEVISWLSVSGSDQEVISWLSVSGPLFVGIREVQEKVSEKIEKALGLAICIAHWT